TGKRFSFSVAIRNSFTAGVQIRESAEAKLEADDASFTPRRRLRLVRQEDPQMLPNIPNYQCGADSADIRLTPANVRFWG
ncbi:MAG: hypothetical protein WCD64_08930, partial [Pseudolabrys sp.]